jgi:adenosylhomocysteine nucleosidase
MTILGALQRELSYIIKLVGATKNPEGWPFPAYISKRDSSEITIFQTGMGTVRAGAALKAVLERFRPDCIMSVGFAGALYPGAAPGDLVRGTRLFMLPAIVGDSATSSASESELNPRLSLPGRMADRLTALNDLRDGSIITLNQQMEKGVLAKQIPGGLPFPVCDMETFSLAELSLRRDIPFLGIRSVSDTLEEEVPPELFGVVGETGQPNLGRLFYSVTTNPALVTDVLRLRRNSEAAARSLGLLIEELSTALP